MRAVKAQTWLAVVLVLSALFSIGASLKTSHDTGRTNHCLIGFIAENSRVSQLRAAANMKREQAVTDVLDGVATLTLAQHSDDPAKADRQAGKAATTYRELLTTYREKTAEVAAERARNPLPDLPETCGDIS